VPQLPSIDPVVPELMLMLVLRPVLLQQQVQQVQQSVVLWHQVH
jgi:hypothetical protein